MGENLADQMRKAVRRDQFNGKKIVAILLFSAIVMVFIFYGFNNKTMGPTGHVAQVNNTLISLADLQREQNRIQQYYAQMFGGALDFSAQRQLLVQEAVQNLVTTELVSQAAEEEGIGATDQEVLDFIVKDFPSFQVNGVFQRDRYFQFLEMNRFSPADFEELIRKDIETMRTRRAFEWTAWPNKLELEKSKKMQDVQMILSYISLNPRELEGQINVKTADVQAALAKPEFLKRVQDEFQARKSQFDQPEQVKAQHILVSVTPGNMAAEKAALEKIMKIREQANSVDFGKLAEQNSDDPGSKSKKGDLGFFGRGQMVPEFDQQVFSMKVGEISQPVKTQFGYHIIKLNARKEAVAATFEAHKNQLAQALLARDLINAEKEKAQEAFQKGDEKAWMEKLQVSWKTTEPFSMDADSVPGVSSDKVVQALPELIAAPQNVQIIKDGDIQYIVKLKDIRAGAKANEKNLDTETLTRMKAAQAYEAWVQSYRKNSTVEVNPDVLKQ